MAQLGHNIIFVPAWSLWSNVFNEWKHASAYITIQNFLGDMPKKVLTQENKYHYKPYNMYIIFTKNTTMGHK